MNKVYQVYQVSDSTGETLDRIFLAIKAQFSNFKYKTIHYSFTRTENQVDKIISQSKTRKKYNNFVYDCRQQSFKIYGRTNQKE